MSLPHLTLISHALCPYVQRAAIVLAERDVPFERIDIDLNAKPDWFLKLSPLGKVPVLVVAREGEEAIVFESSVICEYLDETQPGPRLHPDDPLERAHHRGWMEFGSQILADLWKVQTAPAAADFDRGRKASRAKFETLEQRLGHGPYFAGDRFSLVDAVFGPIFRQVGAVDMIAPTGILDGLPAVEVWKEALAARPSVQGAAPADYVARLRRFTEEHGGHLLQAA